MHIFFSVGEPSGDQHAAQLMHELRRRRPDIQFSGFGGPLMEQAGCRLLFRLTDLAVMFIWSVLPLLWRFFQLLRQAGNFLRSERPDAVVLIDYPGFNWWIARKAKAAGIPVFYYLPPQMWAWGGWRIRKMRKYVDHVLCGLPFEPEWYAQRGLTAQYTGHPFFDEVAQHRLDDQFCRSWSGPKTVGVLPGSRTKEVVQLWPLMIRIMRRLHAKHPDVRFLVACYKDDFRDLCRQTPGKEGIDLPIDFFVGKTPEIIEASQCCLMTSGSVSLEMLARRTPAAVIYRCARWSYPFVRLVVRLNSMTLPNLIAGRRVLPERLAVWRPGRDVRKLTEKLDGWLQSDDLYEAKVRELDALYQDVFLPNAIARTAEVILERLPAAPARQAA